MTIAGATSLLWIGFTLFVGSWFIISVTAGLVALCATSGALLMSHGLRVFNQLDLENALGERDTGWTLDEKVLGQEADSLAGKH